MYVHSYSVPPPFAMRHRNNIVWAVGGREGICDVQALKRQRGCVQTSSSEEEENWEPPFASPSFFSSSALNRVFGRRS